MHLIQFGTSMSKTTFDRHFSAWTKPDVWDSECVMRAFGIAKKKKKFQYNKILTPGAGLWIISAVKASTDGVQCTST